MLRFGILGNWTGGDRDSFVIPSERGKDVAEYIKEMREKDRL